MLLSLEKIKTLWERLMHLEASPRQIAMGFAAGFFVSFFPIVPLQTPVALALAFLLQSNLIACMIGLHIHLICLPIIPIIFTAEYGIGRWICGVPVQRHVSFNHILLSKWLNHGWPIFYSMMVGAMILALPSALLTYPMILRAATRWQELRRSKGTPPSAPAREMPPESED